MPSGAAIADGCLTLMISMYSVTPSLLDPQTLTRLERLVAIARRVSAPVRRRQRRRPGRGIEHGTRREYAPGDDVRMIDWPAYARLGRLLIKVQEQLPEPHLDIILDGSGSMGSGHPSPHLRASLAASALCACAVARQVQVTVWFAGEPPARHPLHRPGQLVELLRFLHGLAPSGPAALDTCVEWLLGSTRTCGGAVILSDGLDPAPLAAAATRLHSHGFSSVVVVVGASAELEPAVASLADQSGLAELVDAESGQRRQVPFCQLALELAARARAARATQLAALLEPASLALEVLDPHAPFESIALGLLRG